MRKAVNLSVIENRAYLLLCATLYSLGSVLLLMWMTPVVDAYCVFKAFLCLFLQWGVRSRENRKYQESHSVSCPCCFIFQVQERSGQYKLLLCLTLSCLPDSLLIVLKRQWRKPPRVVPPHRCSFLFPCSSISILWSTWISYVHIPVSGLDVPASPLWCLKVKQNMRVRVWTCTLISHMEAVSQDFTWNVW